jgi:hypothetical protein
VHTTNYVNTFITVAPDTAARSATVPPARAVPSVAERTFHLIAEHPRELTSDDVLFTVWADRRGVAESDRGAARADFFSRGQACLRSSDLVKRYGWGVYSDADGRVTLVPLGSAEYDMLAEGRDPSGHHVTVLPGMRSARG